MDDLKIIIDAILNENIEKNINEQLKRIKIDALNLDVQIKNASKSTLTNHVENVAKEINTVFEKNLNINPDNLYKGIIQSFGIKNREIRAQMKEQVKEYAHFLRTGDKEKISASYESLFSSIKYGLQTLVFNDLDTYEQEFLNRFKNIKLYVSDYLKNDFLSKGEYKGYADKMIGKLTTDSKSGIPIDTLYQELHSDFTGLLPPIEEVTHIGDQFRVLVDKITEFRETAKKPLDIEGIMWRYGEDDEIKKSIDEIVSKATIGSRKVEKAVLDTQSKIKASTVNLSDSIIHETEKTYKSFEKEDRKIKVPFRIDLSDSGQIRNEMSRLVSEFTQNQGSLIDYKIFTRNDLDPESGKRVEVLTGAVLKYKNALDEIIKKKVTLSKIGTEEDEKGIKDVFAWSVSANEYSQNIEKVVKTQEKLIESTQKTANKLLEYQKAFDILQIKTGKSEISLNETNITGFNEAIKTQNLEQARHLLNLLQKEWLGLNAAMVKEMPNTALENMNKYISKMPFSIQSVELKFRNLVSPTKELTDRITHLKKLFESLEKSGSNDEKLATYGKLKVLISEVNAELNNEMKIQRQMQLGANLVFDKKVFSNNMDNWLRNNAEAAKVFEERVSKIKSEIENADRASLLNLKKQFQDITSEARKTGVAVSSMDKILDVFKSLGTFIIGGNMLSFAERSIHKIYEKVKELDTAMVDVKKVTAETNTVYRQFLNEASDSAVKLGAKISDLLVSTSDFVRLGYSLEDAFHLSKTATLYKNTSYVDIDTATKDIVSAMKAFNIEAKDSEQIIDKLNNIGNKFSISSAGLGQGLKNSASSLATANNSLNETLGLITAANQVIQNPSEAGNALKILSLRLRNVKGELEDIGESTDGMVESITKLQTQLLNLTGGKVNIMLNADTFKSTYQIMKELSSVWDDLTDVKKANVIELIAGKQRANTITSILTHMKTAEDVVEVAMNSAGAAAIEQEKALDSIAVKLEQMAAASQKFSSSMIDSGFIKFLVDMGTSSFLGLTDLIENLGAVPTILSAISASMSLFNKSGMLTPFSLMKNEIDENRKSLAFLGKDIETMKKQWNEATSIGDKIKNLFSSKSRLEADSNFANQLEIDKLALRNFNSAMGHGVSSGTAFEKTMKQASEAAKTYAYNSGGATVNIKSFVTAQNAAATATKASTFATIGLTIAQTALNAAFTMGVSLLIQGIIQGLDYLIRYSSKVKEASEQAKSEFDTLNNEIQSVKKEIETLDKRLTELGKKKNLSIIEQDEFNKLTKTNEELERQLKIKEQIAKTKGKDAEKAAVKSFGHQFERSLFEDEADGFNKGWDILADIPIPYVNLIRYSDQLIRKIEEQKMQQNELNSSFDRGEISVEKYQKKLDKMIKNQEDYESKLAHTVEELSKTKESLIGSTPEGDSLSTQIDDVLKAYDRLTDTASLKEKFDKIFDNPKFLEIKQELLNLTQIGKLTAESFSDPKFKEFADELEKIGINAEAAMQMLNSMVDTTSIKSLTSNISSVEKSLEGIEKSIVDVASSLSSLDDAIHKVTDGSYLSGQEISKLILKYPELADKVLQTADGYTFEIKVLEALREAKINEKKTAIEAELAITQQTLNSISARLQGYKSEIGAIRDVAQAKAALAEMDEKSKHENFFSNIWRGITGKPQISKVKSDLESYISISDKVVESQKRINALNTSLSLVSLPNYTRAVNEASKAVANKNKELGKQKKLLETQEKALEKSKKAINDLLDMTVKMLKKQKEIEKENLKQSLDGYKKKIELMKNALDMQKYEHDYQANLTKKNRNISETQNKLDVLQFDDSAEAQKKRKELQKQLIDQQEELKTFLYDDGVKRQKDALDKEYKQFEDNTQKQIKNIENYLSQEGVLRNEAMRLIEQRTNEFYNNLLRWNALYGDGISSTVTKAWDSAYFALQKFNYKQFDVSGVLVRIDSQIENIKWQIQNVNDSMAEFSNTTRSAARTLDIANISFKNFEETKYKSEIERYRAIIKSLQGQKGSYPAITYYQDRINRLQGYASGTFSAKKGLAAVDEKGKELILSKADGRYRFMNDGDMVFTNEATKALWEFANSPAKFVTDKLSPKLKNISNFQTFNNSVSPTINISIQGDATQSTVNALKSQSENIINKAVEKTFKTANKFALIR